MSRIVNRAAGVLFAGLVATTVQAQQVRNDDPIWVPQQADAPDAGPCAQPTLQQCSDPGWLYSADPCAIVQNAPDSECAGLLYFDMDTRAGDGDEEVFIVAKNLEETGVRSLIRTSPGAIQQQAEYVPDLFSIASKKAGVDYAGADQIGVDIYAFWDGNGSEIDSCREYAYEKFYDVNEYQRHIGPFRDDYGRAYEAAYAPAYNDWAIGSRHLNDYRLRAKDGRQFGSIFNNALRAKNEFFRIPQHPAIGTEGFGFTGPGLLTSLALFDQVTAARLEKIASHKVGNQHLVAKSWLFNKQMKDVLSYQPAEDGEPNDVFNADLLYAPQQNGQVQLLDNLQYADGPQARKRLYEELDELHDLQRRLQKYIDEWRDLDVRFVDSGWNVTDAGLEDDTPDLQQLQYNAIQPNEGFGFQVAQPPQPGPIQQGLDFQSEDVETLLRQRVLEDIVELLAVADAEACLEAGRTACDWSPKEFVTKALLDFSAFEDNRYDWCQDFTGGSVANVKNLDIVFVEHPQFYCDVVTGDSITAAQLDALQQRVEECREAKIAYEDWLAVEEAKNRVRAIPELVDPATGGFVMPGLDKSRDEYMGNKYFGLGYDYAFGFGMDVQSEICTINMGAGGHLNAYTKVFGQDVSLIDAAANADTETREVHVHGKVLGIELFTGIDETWATQEDFHFNIVKKPNKKKSQTIIDTTIVVVIVPIGIELGISGEVGAVLGITLDTEGLGGDACPSVIVGGLVEPYIAVNGFVSAAIDIFIAAAGVRGEINIITVSLPFKPGIGLSIIGDMNGDILPDGLELLVKAKLDLVLETLSGNIYAFAEIGFCPFCYTGEFTIVKWTGPRWVQNIFDHTYTINLADIDSAFN